MIRKPSPYAQAVILLAVFLGLCLTSIWRKTLTSDEPFHFKYGSSLLKLDSTRFDNSKMPFSAINAVPCCLGERLGGSFPDQGSGVGGVLCHRTTARAMTMLVALILGVYVFVWSRDLYGPKAGLLSLVLFVFSPNLIAHARLITTDLFLACAATAASYHFWRFLEKGGRKRTAASALSLGLSQLAKYTAVFLYPIFLAVLAIRRGPELVRAWRGSRAALGPSLRRLGVYTLVFAVTSVAVINVGYLFNGSFSSLEDYEFRSSLFQGLQNRLELVGAVPLPLPYPHLQGLDWVKESDDRGTTNANLYLLEELRHRQDPDRAFTGYFLVAWLFKVPLATQALVLWSLWSLIRGFRLGRFLRAELYLLAPVAFFTVYFNFFFRTQIGFRFFLLVVPFLLVLCGRVLDQRQPSGRARRAGVAGLASAVALSTLSYFPHYLSYFNELVWDRHMSYKVLADSNIEWGQDRGYLKEYARQHPEAIVHPKRPMPGRIVVSVNRLVGVFRMPLYPWLRDNFEPVDRVAGSYLIFEITPAALERALGPPEPGEAAPDGRSR